MSRGFGAGGRATPDRRRWVVRAQATSGQIVSVRHSGGPASPEHRFAGAKAPRRLRPTGVDLEFPRGQTEAAVSLLETIENARAFLERNGRVFDFDLPGPENAVF